MGRNQQQRAGWAIATAVAAAIGVSTTAARAEDVTVKLPAASVLAGKTARSAKVVQLKQGDKLQVVGREGAWLKVKYAGQEGFIHENSVAAGGGGGGGLSGIGKFLSGSDASASSSAEAGRGLGESAAWARSNNMNASGLQRMIAIRNSVGDADWQQFAADGKGGAK
jgi:hypothetical protein